MATKTLPQSSVPLQLQIAKKKPLNFEDVSSSLTSFLESEAAAGVSADTTFHLSELQKFLSWAVESRLEGEEIKVEKKIKEEKEIKVEKRSKEEKKSKRRHSDAKPPKESKEKKKKTA
jgi:hypothetical protein